MTKWEEKKKEQERIKRKEKPFYRNKLITLSEGIIEDHTRRSIKVPQNITEERDQYENKSKIHIVLRSVKEM